MALNKNKSAFIWLIVPIIFLLTSQLVHRQKGVFYTNTVDPEYFYLYCGGLIASGDLAPEYTAHPGFPLQILCGFSSAITSFFSSYPVIEDIVREPEKHIHSANLLQSVIICVIVILLGTYSWKITESLIIRVLLQITIFSSLFVLRLAGRLFAESFLIIPLLIMLVGVINFIGDPNREDRSDYWLWVFSVIVGFGIATKLSFAPMIFWPMVLLIPRWKKCFHLFWRSILFFCVFAYPIFFNLNDYFEWVWGMTSHNGMYGSGSTGFIDFGEIGPRMKELFKSNKWFFVLVIFSFLASIIGLFLPKQRINRVLLISNIGLTIGFLFSMILVLKHYKLHYYFPFYTLGFVSFLFLLAFVHSNIQIMGKNISFYFSIISSVILLPIVLSEVKRLRHYQQDQVTSCQVIDKNVTQMSLARKSEEPLIICAYYSGAPFVQFAHVNGLLMCGNHKGKYVSVLNDVYPQTYHWFSWTDQLYIWDKYESLETFLGNNESFQFYCGRAQEDKLDKFISSLTLINPDINIDTAAFSLNPYGLLVNFGQK